MCTVVGAADDDAVGAASSRSGGGSGGGGGGCGRTLPSRCNLVSRFTQFSAVSLAPNAVLAVARAPSQLPPQALLSTSAQRTAIVRFHSFCSCSFGSHRSEFAPHHSLPAPTRGTPKWRILHISYMNAQTR